MTDIEKIKEIVARLWQEKQTLNSQQRSELRAITTSIRGDMPHRLKSVRCNQEYQKVRSKWLGTLSHCNVS